MARDESSQYRPIYTPAFANHSARYIVQSAVQSKNGRQQIFNKDVIGTSGELIDPLSGITQEAPRPAASSRKKAEDMQEKLRKVISTPAFVDGFVNLIKRSYLTNLHETPILSFHFYWEIAYYCRDWRYFAGLQVSNGRK
jgi:hypothetical protein